MRGLGVSVLPAVLTTVENNFGAVAVPCPAAPSGGSGDGPERPRCAGHGLSRIPRRAGQEGSFPRAGGTAPPSQASFFEAGPSPGRPQAWQFMPRG